MRPADMTRMRSQSAISSGSSLETTEHRFALGGQSAQHLVHGVLGRDVDAPVGSSNNNTRPSRASHRAMRTFCWLPPLSSPTGCSTDAH